MDIFSRKNPLFAPALLVSGIIMLLFWLLSILGLHQLHNGALAGALYEKIPFTVELKTETKAAEGLELQKFISAQEGIKPQSVIFLDKNEALDQLKRDLNLNAADSGEILVENPLPDVIQFKLKAGYFHQKEQLITLIEQQPIVQTVWQSSTINQQLPIELTNTARWFSPNKWGWWGLYFLCLAAAAGVYGLLLAYFCEKDKDKLATIALYADNQAYILRTYQPFLLKISILAALGLLLLMVCSQLLQTEAFFEINQPYSYAILYLSLLTACPLSVWLAVRGFIYSQTNTKKI